jgi:hypothetical protein
VAEQRVRIEGMVRIERDADAARDVEVELVDRDRVMEALDESFGDRDRRRVVRDVAHQDAELVSTEAGHQVFVPERPGEARTDGGEQLVPHMVAERVVDLLEVVEVHQHHGEAAAVRRRVLDRVPELHPEQEPVGQTGQMVVERLVLVLSLLLRQLLGRDLQRVRAVKHLPGEREWRDEHRDRPRADRLGRDRDEDAEQGEPHVGDDELPEHAAVHLPQNRFERCAALDRLPLRDQDRVDGVADDGGEQDGHAHDEPVGVEVREPAEDLALGEHRERDLGSHEYRREGRDLTPELAGVRRAEKDDQGGDRRRVEQRDG